MDPRLDAVHELWGTYREHGVEAAIPLLHSEVEFVTHDGLRGDYLLFVHGFREGRVCRVLRQPVNRGGRPLLRGGRPRAAG